MAVIVFAKPPSVSLFAHEPCATYAIRNLLSAHLSLPLLFSMSPNNTRSSPHDPLSRFFFLFRSTTAFKEAQTREGGNARVCPLPRRRNYSLYGAFINFA
jgi:hypothetical protein